MSTVYGPQVDAWSTRKDRKSRPGIEGDPLSLLRYLDCLAITLSEIFL